MARRMTSGNGPQVAVSAGPADGHTRPVDPVAEAPTALSRGDVTIQQATARRLVPVMNAVLEMQTESVTDCKRYGEVYTHLDAAYRELWRIAAELESMDEGTVAQ